MTLPELCIRRPVFATVLSLVILLMGLISYDRLSVREYPRIDEPVVSVNTTYRGASAEVVESQVTKVIEDSLSGIEGVQLMTSRSRSERSQINVRFQLSRDPESLARSLAVNLRTLHHPKLLLAFDCLLAIGPEHARVFRAAGWSKPKLLARLGELLQVPGEEVVRGAGGIAEGLPEGVRGATLPKFRPDGIRIVQFNEAPAGQSVFHLHFHVIPVYEGVPVGRHGNSGKADDAELAAQARAIAAAL